jgi:hypothetical protein
MPAAAPETNVRRLIADTPFFPQIFIDVHLRQRRWFDGPLTIRFAPVQT